MKILVIEDNPSLRETLCDSLQEDGYLVESSDNGSDGLYRLQTYDYDAAILDIGLPDHDGFEVLQKIRSDKQTPIILLTARDSLNDRVAGLDFGADDYVTKPFDLPELLARIRAVTRRGRGQRATTIHLDDITLNTVKREATRNSTVIELTSREYAILETLVQMRGQAVSRHFLYEHLYSEDEATLSNVLDVYICRLRNKFGKDFIKTQRGFGYIVHECEPV